MAYLANGDVSAAWEASQRALPTITNQCNLGNCNWVVYAALAAGELTTASHVAEMVVSRARGYWLAMALTARARVKIAGDESRSAEDDLHEALAAAAESGSHLSVPDALECLGQLACAATRNRPASLARRTRCGSVWARCV